MSATNRAQTRPTRKVADSGRATSRATSDRASDTVAPSTVFAPASNRFGSTAARIRSLSTVQPVSARAASLTSGSV